MTWPNWPKVRLILWRELLDQFRDGRTLFMVAVVPLLLYPLVAIGFVQLAQFSKRHPSKILLILQARAPGDEESLRKGATAAHGALVQLEFQLANGTTPDDLESSAADMIQAGTYDLIACLASPRSSPADPAGYGRHHDGPDAADSNRPKGTGTRIYYQGALDRSYLAYQRINPLLLRWGKSEQGNSKHVAKDSRADTAPSPPPEAPVAVTDLSDAGLKQAAFWSKILPFVVFVWALTGAFYPAVDFCAGEKERGTLETLLVSAASRLDIVWGKLLATMTFSAVTALLNLACMLLTASFLLRQVAGFTGSPDLLQTTAPPWSALAWIIIALIPMTALFGSLALALASMARSTKEGQYYLLPLLLGFMPLMMLAMIPSTRLDLGTSLLPVTGIMLCLRYLMEGEFTPVWAYSLPALAVTLGCCALAIRWAVNQFNNEDVLFFSGDRLSLKQRLIQSISRRRGAPTAFLALGCGLLILFLRFFAGGAIGFPDSWKTFALYTAGTLVAFVAAPAVVMAFLFTSDPKQTLLWNRPRAGTLLAAVALAICLHPFATALMATVRQCYPIDTESLAPLRELLESAPSPWSLLLLMAVLPAVCEELAFRGLILSGLRQHGIRFAIVVSALLFAMAHGAIQQALIAAVFGWVLAYLAIQTNCLFACIAFHATHNALGLLAAEWLPRWGAIAKQFPWLINAAHDPISGDATYIYGIVILLPGVVLAGLILAWLGRHGSCPARQSAADGQHAITPPNPTTVPRVQQHRIGVESALTLPRAIDR